MRGARGLDRFERCDQCRVACLACVDAHALVESHEMRRRVQARPEPGAPIDRLEHRARRSLAVRPRDGDHRAIDANRHSLRDGGDAIEAHRDRFRMERFEVGQPGVQRSGTRHVGLVRNVRRRPRAWPARFGGRIRGTGPAAASTSRAGARARRAGFAGRRSCRARPSRPGIRRAGSLPAAFRAPSAR